MKLYSQLMAGALLLGLWSCSADDPNGPDAPNNPQGDIYTQLTLQLPETRSETTANGESNTGKEYGKDYENNVESIRVILATKESDGSYKYVAKGISQNAILDQSQNRPTFSITFQSEELEKLAGKPTTPGTPGVGSDYVGQKTKVYVFAYCNPTDELSAFIESLASATDDVKKNFVNQIAKMDSELASTDGRLNTLPWAKENSFTMTNASLTTADLPDYATLISRHNTKATAFNLGEVSVERVVSRFDLDDSTNEFMIKDNISGLNAAKITFVGMSLINEAKEFYYLPRISNNADWSVTDLCGSETVSNWMVSPNYAAKIAFAEPKSSYDAIKDNYLFANALPKDLNFTWVTGIDDNDEGWTGSANTQYKIWRYATENTMPTAAMKNGITTGIVFKAEILSLTEEESKANATTTQTGILPGNTIRNAMNAGLPLYAWTGDAKNPENNVMLGSAKDVWVYAYTHPSSAIRTSFLEAVTAGKFIVKRNGVTDNLTTADAIFPTPTTELPLETIKTQFTVTGPTENVQGTSGQPNFMVYMPTNLGTDDAPEYHYYVYYRYYNRHNNNGKPDLMGPMEFATVRNNIYKLKVNTVAAFGLPGDLPVDPNKDDETPEVYFKVSVRVLDWIVRINGIDF